ncbi:hypothetical protein CWATWH0005_2393 [Crocosphaera watsonii WH 0005]|uniref:Uncharacterized protein n=1 Tax=Crocosphaera watsonii WH 0005 TaxID=423472 RepID=T2IWG6_CROWT|nr:hypothetical protein CWATWH0005_2393 [Crocosphaera watsonii WH 0005]
MKRRKNTIKEIKEKPLNLGAPKQVSNRIRERTKIGFIISLNLS